MKLHFVTGNTGKFMEMQEHLGDHVDLIQSSVELIEPQGDSVEEVATAKAEQAFNKIDVPLIIEDSGLHIDALYGMPGPFVKQASKWAGPQGFCDMIHPDKPRTCKWTRVIIYMDKEGEAHSFIDKNIKGSITKQPFEGTLPVHAKGELSRIYQPDGFNKTIAEMDETEWKGFIESRKDHSAYARFAEWFTD